MPAISVENKRSQDRRKAVLPVRVRGIDVSGTSFDDLAHTLDVTPAGVRLGGIRHEVKKLDRITILYRKRKMEFEVIWTKKLDKVNEYQVGLHASAQEAEAWGLNMSDFKPAMQLTPAAAPEAVSQTAGAL